MYVPDKKMKINRFQQVAIPKNSEYLRRFGNTVAPSSQYTGDVLAPIAQSKMDMIAAADLMDLQEQRAMEKSGNE